MERKKGLQMKKKEEEDEGLVLATFETGEVANEGDNVDDNGDILEGGVPFVGVVGVRGREDPVP